MKELELKFLEVDVDSLIELLESKGAKKNVDGILKTTYFDNAEGDIKRTNELVRVRTFGDQIEFCRKINMRIEDGCKVYDELEVHVSDYDSITEILESLGYKPTMRFEKKRIEYALKDGSKFEIEFYPGIPPFVEIEARDFARITELAKEFNLEGYETTNLVGEEVLRQKYNVEQNGLTF